MKWYIKVLKQCFDFSGRARRKEYWMFVLFNSIFGFVAIMLDSIYGMERSGYFQKIGPIFILYNLLTIMPRLAVEVRRLHDVGKSGWMVLLSLIPIIGTIWIFILMITDSVPSENRWGKNPKEVAAT